jgi:hypothetical protein
MTAYEKNEAPPPEKLDSYLNLYKKVKHWELGQLGGNKRFVPASTEGGDIKILNTYRNEFIHFTPKSWILEVNSLPRICLSVARLISFLALETTNVFWHNPAARQQLLDTHYRFTSTMRKLQLLYGQVPG